MNHEYLDDQLIEFGAVTEETKGPAPVGVLDTEGGFIFALGLTED